LTVVERLAENHPEMGALVIECTDLPPFAHLIQEKIRVPVFDIVTLTNMIYETLMRTPYQGILPRRVLVE
jgi:Asp/Glu/hydantoin racemase